VSICNCIKLNEFTILAGYMAGMSQENRDVIVNLLNVAFSLTLFILVYICMKKYLAFPLFSMHTCTPIKLQFLLSKREIISSTLQLILTLWLCNFHLTKQFPTVRPCHIIVFHHQNNNKIKKQNCQLVRRNILSKL
jgi:hypothetical protein